jgi:hypothetical protein
MEKKKKCYNASKISKQKQYLPEFSSICNTRRYWSLPKYEYCRYRKILGNTGNTSIADTGRFWKILVIDFICRSYQNKTGKLLGLWEAMRPVIPAISLFSMMIIWAVFSSCDILELYPRLVYLTTGTVFSNIAVSSSSILPVSSSICNTGTDTGKY